MRRLHRFLLASAMCAGIAACSDQLNVENQNNADEDRALKRPTDVEALISGSFNTMHGATVGNTFVGPQALTLGMENYSTLANFSMGVRAAIPRPPIDNSRGNSVASDNYNAFLRLHRAARAAAIGLNAVNKATFAFFPPNANQNARARAFAQFVIGVSLGYVSMVYDSGSAVNENDDLTSLAPLPLIGFDSLNTYALSKLDSAIAIANAGPGIGALGLPATWFGTSVGAPVAATMTTAQFVALVRGWAARIRAGVARDSVSRVTKVNWTKVIADAAAFTAVYTTDFVQNLNPAQGWDNQWLPTMYSSNSVNWHMMWGYMAYMAAPQSEFEPWLQTAGGPGARQQFTMHSADLRWPQGATRANQQADLSAQRYVENRGSDWFGDASANSQYRHKRFLALSTAARIGPMPTMTTAEMNLLQAEGQFYAGNYAAAAALIDLTRAAAGKGGLPGLVANGVTNTVTLVPGGGSCVPRIPVGPTFTTTVCGNLWEALKYEKRMETQFTGWVNWWFDSRGWGDLPANTPPHWPVPYQEMDTRNEPFYSMSGSSGPGHYGI